MTINESASIELLVVEHKSVNLIISQENLIILLQWNCIIWHGGISSKYILWLFYFLKLLDIVAFILIQFYGYVEQTLVYKYTHYAKYVQLISKIMLVESFRVMP